MAKVINRIAETTKATLLFNYIPDQETEARELYTLCSIATQSRIKFDVFAASLRDFLGLLSHCTALIGNEGGAVNMAKALNVPTFSIFSPWVPKASWNLFSDTKNTAVHITDYKPGLTETKNHKKHKAAVFELYNEFKPGLFMQELTTFLNTLCHDNVVHFDLAKTFRGGQRQALLLHSNLLNMNVNSYLIADINGLLYKKCTDKGVRNSIGMSFPGIKPILFSRLLSIRKVSKKLNAIQPDILHFHEPASLIFNNFIKGYQTFETRRVSFPIKDSSIRLKYSKIDVHVGVSHEITNYLKEKGLKNVHTVRSALDLERFQPPKQQHILRNKSRKNLLYVGSFSDMKGIDILLKAFKIVITKNTDNVTLHLVGDGEKFEAYRELAETLQLRDHTVFYGRSDTPEHYYPEADAVIVPSRSGEGSNGIIKEAMASGKITIASDMVCNRELIVDGVDGILFASENENDLALKIATLLQEKYILNAKHILEKAQGFSDRIMARKYHELYNQYL